MQTISAVLDDKLIDLGFYPVRPGLQVFYRYPDVSEKWHSCLLPPAGFLHLSDEEACAKVHNWVKKFISNQQENRNADN